MPPAAERLSPRALNRALLARQGLLERYDAPLPEVVEAIGALQAQAWTAPPVALWSRLHGFTLDDLHDALARRELVSGILLRATLHLVSAREHPAYSAVVEASGLTEWRRTKGEPSPESDGLRARLLEHAAEVPRTGEELAAVADDWVRAHPDAIVPEEVEEQRSHAWRRLLRWSALTRVPADGHWTSKAPAALLAAPRAASTPASQDALNTVVRRHLRAFGPASAEDVASWIGWRTPPVREALEKLEPELVTFEDEDRRRLYDLPDAPRPDPARPAPARFLAAFDSVLLAYPSKRRTRIVPEPLRDLVYLRRNLQVRPSFLLDGRVAGIWSTEVRRREATLTLTPGVALARAERSGLIEEGERLVRWLEPGATAHHVVVANA